MDNSFLNKKVSFIAGVLIIAVAALVILGGTFWYASYLTVSSYLYKA